MGKGIMNKPAYKYLLFVCVIEYHSISMKPLTTIIKTKNNGLKRNIAVKKTSPIKAPETTLLYELDDFLNILPRIHLPPKFLFRFE